MTNGLSDANMNNIIHIDRREQIGLLTKIFVHHLLHFADIFLPHISPAIVILWFTVSATALFWQQCMINSIQLIDALFPLHSAY